MSFLNFPLTLKEALRLAEAAGLSAELHAGFASHRHELLVSLDTIDPNPTVSIRTDYSDFDELLSRRSQSGPERWDYSTSFEEFRDRVFLRLGNGESQLDVPMLPAVLGVVERYGLAEDVSFSAPARLNREQFDQAVATLVSTGHRSVVHANSQ